MEMLAVVDGNSPGKEKTTGDDRAGLSHTLGRIVGTI